MNPDNPTFRTEAEERPARDLHRQRTGMKYPDGWTIWEYQYPKRYKPLPRGWVVLCDGSHCWGYHKETETEMNIHWNQYVARRWVFEEHEKQLLAKSERGRGWEGMK
jgi:hypothetical protein